MITKSVTARAVSRTRPIVNHGVLQSEEPMYQIRHGSHLKAPISVTPSLPHGHFKHALAPRSPANLPVGHEVQDVLPASDANVPMFQSVCVFDVGRVVRSTYPESKHHILWANLHC